MKTKQLDLKNLKGVLTREEMKAIKGGDVIYCTDCGGLDPAGCWAKYCQSKNCWFSEGTSQTYLCQCSGDC